MTDRPTLPDLIANRELDYLILAAVDPEKFALYSQIARVKLEEARRNGLTDRAEACRRFGFYDCPSYTRLLDDALLVVPPHHLWQVKQGIQAEAIVWRIETDYDDHPAPTGYSTTFPAIALCIAALKAAGGAT